MFCQNCGTSVQPGQQSCGKCATPLTGYLQDHQSRLRRHLHLVGIFWIGYSALHLLGASALWIVANTIFSPYSRVAVDAPFFIHPMLTGIAFFLLLLSSAGIAAGWGLMQRLDWARVLAIVLAFVALMSFPFGTLLGVYTIWSLLSPGADDEYRAMARQTGP